MTSGKTRLDKDKDRERESKDQSTSLWSRANSLRQSLRYRTNKHHVHSTSVSVLIDDLPKSRRPPGGQNAPLRREWGSYRDLSRSRKAQSTATLQDANTCTKSLVRRHSSKSRPGELSLSLTGTASTPLQPFLGGTSVGSMRSPPLAVQEETGILSCDTGSLELDCAIEPRGNANECWDRDSRPGICIATLDSIDRKDLAVQRKSSAQQQRKLTKDSGYETSVCSEPDYVNATFFSYAGEPHGTALPTQQPVFTASLSRAVVASSFENLKSRRHRDFSDVDAFGLAYGATDFGVTATPFHSKLSSAQNGSPEVSAAASHELYVGFAIRGEARQIQTAPTSNIVAGRL
ncbi:hypothetical protein BIW11_14291 [Tropilaelaps mercedesae]|uniref:Uncharacterized protein n=1 Tax=Tropilaelaps mercedesae TaxID=418985 RepID=A0A1V9WYJ7_9ACAR|nr:hypothetical protein BIW11_14291 [Tropilaelaps mercedesae]